MNTMIKTVAGTILAGLASLMLTGTAYAGDCDGGFYLAVTDDGAGVVSAWEEDDFPVDVDDCDNLRLTTDYGIGYITR